MQLATIVLLLSPSSFVVAVVTVHHVSTVTETSREYDLDLRAWYVPLSVYTEDVDYPDVDVQVRVRGGRRQGGKEEGVCVWRRETERDIPQRAITTSRSLW